MGLVSSEPDSTRRYSATYRISPSYFAWSASSTPNSCRFVVLKSCKVVSTSTSGAGGAGEKSLRKPGGDVAWFCSIPSRSFSTSSTSLAALFNKPGSCSGKGCGSGGGTSGGGSTGGGSGGGGFSVGPGPVGDHLKDARELNVTLSGDAFGSPVFFTFLRELDASLYPELRITLCTNGIGLTERNWNRICNEAVDVVYISMDAATSETYAVNRGGNLVKLLDNLNFVSTLMTSGNVKGFTISFVVQANNYHEMPAFGALRESVNASSVLFIQVGNTGVFTKEEYERRAVHLPTHPEHNKLLEVLKNPALGSPIVDLRNFDRLRGDSSGRKASGPPPTQESFLQAVQMIQTYSAQLTKAGIDGTTVLDETVLPNSKAEIRSALSLVIASANSEEEKEKLAIAQRTLAFFQSGVTEGRAPLDTIAFENETWASIVKAEMLEHAK